jgi:hypothetical protein
MKNNFDVWAEEDTKGDVWYFCPACKKLLAEDSFGKIEWICDCK